MTQCGRPAACQGPDRAEDVYILPGEEAMPNESLADRPPRTALQYDADNALRRAARVDLAMLRL